MRTKTWRRSSGFSMAELVIIVSLIGVLTAVGTPVISNSEKMAMGAETDANLGKIRLHLELYLADQGRYPEQLQPNYVIGAKWNNLNGDNLTGKYFDYSAYTYYGGPEGKSFKISCDRAPYSVRDRTLDQNGVLREE